MGAGEGGGALAPVEGFEALAGGLGGVLGAAGVVGEELGEGLIGAPVAAFDPGDVGADGPAVELVGQGLPGGEILQLAGAGGAAVAAASVDRAAQLLREDALDVGAELGGGAGCGGHGAQFGQAAGELLALEVDQGRQLGDQSIGVAGVADAADLAFAGAARRLAQGGRECVLTDHSDG